MSAGKKILLILLIGIQYVYGQPDTIHKVFYYENGVKSSEGRMFQEKPVGYWKAYYKTGIIKSEGNRFNFDLDGDWNFYNESGDLEKSIAYRDGKKNGVTAIYDGDCNKIREENYINDVLEGEVRDYYPKSGNLKSVTPFHQGFKDGTQYEFNTDGTIITISEFSHGFLKKKEEINRSNALGKQGTWREFYPDSSLKREMRYKNNILHGYYKEYDRDGKLVVALLYIDGIIQENPEELTALDVRREYYENGSLKWEGTYNYLGEKEGTHKEFAKNGDIQISRIYSKNILLARGKLNRRGERTGEWEFYYPDSSLRAKGEYNDGLRIGPWIFYHANGKVEQEGKYVKGEKPHGDWTWFYPNGQIWREEGFWKGEEEGESIEYSDGGTVVSKGHYIDGRKDGFWFYEMGDHREEGSYIEGKREGEWKYYYPDGILNFKGSYISGDPNGKHFYYYPNGRIKREEYYELGYEEGTWRTYDEYGNLMLTTEWQGGREVRLDKKKVK